MTAKKIVAVVLALALCAALCSCQDTGGQTGSTIARIILSIISPEDEPDVQPEVINDVPPDLIEEPDPEPDPEPEPDPPEPDPPAPSEPDPPAPPTPAASGEVPSVAGMTKSEAATTLRTAGFSNVEYAEEYNETVAKGIVVSQSPTAGSDAEFASKVRVVISKGPRIAEGNPAVDFTLPLMNGGEVSLSSYRGKVVFINFWATWCGPCVGELPDIQLLRENYGDELVILAVSVDGASSNESVKTFIANGGYTFTVLRDYNGATYSRTYAPAEGGIPYSAVIDPAGNISFLQYGAPYYAYQVYSAAIDAALSN